MYTGMSTLQPMSPVVERGIALHKVVTYLTSVISSRMCIEKKLFSVRPLVNCTSEEFRHLVGILTLNLHDIWLCRSSIGRASVSG